MFKYFHVCNHQKQNAAPESEIHTIPINHKGKDVQKLIQGAVVLDIKEVRAVTYRPRPEKIDFEYDDVSRNQSYDDTREEYGHYDEASKYYVDYSKYFEAGKNKSNPLPERFYQTYLHNRIKWNVEAPLTYEVTATIRFSHHHKMTYSVGECPICQGRGWYVDILDNKGLFSIEEGIDLIVQRVLKDLLTEVYSSVINLEYGTTIKQTVGGSAKEDEDLFNDVRIIVSEVEDRYLLRQQGDYIYLDLDERLVSLGVKNIMRSNVKKTNIIMDLMIQTEFESRSFRFSI